MVTTARTIDVSSDDAWPTRSRSRHRERGAYSQFLRRELLGTFGLVLLLVMAVTGLTAQADCAL